MDPTPQKGRDWRHRLRKPEIWLPAFVALIVSLAVTLVAPTLRGLPGPFALGPATDMLALPQFASALFGSPSFQADAGPEGTALCEPDVDAFAEKQELEKRGLARVHELPVGGAVTPVSEIKETMILTPSRMNSYSLTDAPENFVGYFAQRGSFFSVLSENVAHIEVLSTFILEDQNITRRSFTESLRNGVGRTHGIFHVDYQDAGTLVGEWNGYTGRNGDMAGCFQFTPTKIGGQFVAGIGRYGQEFSENDTAVVTWGFDALYMSEGLPSGR